MLGLRPLVSLTVGLAALGLAGCGEKAENRAATTAADDGQPGATATVAAAPTGGLGLNPPRSDIRVAKAGRAPGLIFLGPKKVFGAKDRPGQQTGAQIIDSRGRTRYFRPNRGRNVASEVRVQRYEGKPVLTFWSGRLANGTGRGYGAIYDTSYRRIAVLRVKGKDIDADFHEFRLTPQGTALMMAYRKAEDANGKKVVEGVLQEIDIKTKRVVTEWNSLDGVGASESYEPEGARSASSFDYFHINSANLDDDGNIVISARHTWALYKIERRTGKLLWTLGGKDSDFKMGKDSQFAWQHDAVPEGDGVYRIFDNAAGDSGAPKLSDRSRVERIKLDERRKTVTLVDEQEHPDGLSAGTQANSQLLANGNLFVGWGPKGVTSEFDRRGRLIFDAKLPKGFDSYRAYKHVWKAAPAAPPRVAVRRDGGRLEIEAAWNGSTEVRAWRARLGASRDRLRAVGKARWTDLVTTFPVPAGKARYVAVQALDARGRVLRTSKVTRIPR